MIRVRVVMFSATFKKYFSYIEVVSFVGGGNRLVSNFIT
jgi:hypothetical protein